MNKVQIALSAVVMSGAFVGAAQAAPSIKEGEWSISTVMHMEGMGEESAQAMKQMEQMSPDEKAMMDRMMGGMGMKMAAGGQGMAMKIERTQCITASNPVPKADDQAGCTESHTVSGNTVHFAMVCPAAKSTGQVTYTNDTMKGTIKATRMEGGQERSMTIDLDGRYQGPCPPGVNDTIVQKAAMVAESKPAAKSDKTVRQSADETLDAADQSVNTADRAKNTLNNLKSLFGR